MVTCQYGLREHSMDFSVRFNEYKQKLTVKTEVCPQIIVVHFRHLHLNIIFLLHLLVVCTSGCKRVTQNVLF